MKLFHYILEIALLFASLGYMSQLYNANIPFNTLNRLDGLFTLPVHEYYPRVLEYAANASNFPWPLSIIAGMDVWRDSMLHWKTVNLTNAVVYADTWNAWMWTAGLFGAVVAVTRITLTYLGAPH